MNELLSTIFRIGGTMTIVEATGSSKKPVHDRAWPKLRAIRDSKGCITFDSSKTGGLNNRALITVVREPQSTADCTGCAALNMFGGCPKNIALARERKYTHEEPEV